MLRDDEVKEFMNALVLLIDARIDSTCRDAIRNGRYNQTKIAPLDVALRARNEMEDILKRAFR
jgi:hypothetical protein